MNGRGKSLVEVLLDAKSRDCRHVIITGDIVDNPEVKDLQYVREILSNMDLLDSDKLSIVPGNHDVFGGAPSGTSFFKFPMMCKGVNYDDNVDKFIETFKETFPNNNSFPFLKVMDNIAMIGINSVDIWSEDRNPEGSNGEVDVIAFKKISKLLKSEEVRNKYKIVLMHHYFNKMKPLEKYPAHSLWLKTVNRKMKLYGKKILTDLFRKHKVNLVLHGHSHVNHIYNIKGVTYVNSSAACFPLTDDGIRMYNILSIPEEIDTDKNILIETITL
jgi:UDP-2,3-diacylglucosamine pyrophosphatase LpxH